MSKSDKPGISFNAALAELRSASPLDEGTLRAYNGLDGERLDGFLSVWNTLDANRRAYVIEKFELLMEQDFEVDFTGLFEHALSDTDARVRLAAVEGLENDESLTLIDKLISLTRTDPVEDVRAAAAESLGRFMLLGELEKISQRRRDQIYAALMYLLLTEPDTSLVYARALESLAFVSNEEVEHRIRSAYRSGDDDLRVSAVASMGRSADPMYEDVVRGELVSDSADMRAAAALASGELEIVDAVPLLGKMIDDPMPFVALSAVAALGMINSKQAKAHLERALQSEDPEIVAAAEEALESSDILSGDIDISGARLN